MALYLPYLIRVFSDTDLMSQFWDSNVGTIGKLGAEQAEKILLGYGSSNQDLVRVGCILWELAKELKGKTQIGNQAIYQAEWSAQSTLSLVPCYPMILGISSWIFGPITWCIQIPLGFVPPLDVRQYNIELCGAHLIYIYIYIGWFKKSAPTFKKLLFQHFSFFLLKLYNYVLGCVFSHWWEN